MKKLLICLSLIFSFNVGAESPIEVEPLFLQELFAQSGSIKVDDSYSSTGMLSEILGLAMGYAYSNSETKVSHECNYTNSIWECSFVIFSISTEDGNESEGSALIINYKANFDKSKNNKVKISDVEVNYAG